MRHMKTNSATLLPMVFAVAACAADDNQISNSAAPAADPSLAGVSAFEQPSAPAAVASLVASRGTDLAVAPRILARAKTRAPVMAP